MTATEVLAQADCVQFDLDDPLRAFRDQFEIPEGVIYLDGNSLGAKPRSAAACAERVIRDEWGIGLIRSWNTAGWFDLPTRLGDKLAPLIGAGAGQVVVTDSTSINLFKALASALTIAEQNQPARRVIVSERDNFPTDLYIAEGIIGFLDRGYELRLIDDPAELSNVVDSDTAVVMLSHANYRTGNLYDMSTVTAQVQERGALMIWDLAHSAGALEIDLVGSDADFAVGCTYKYLNGGPGSPAFIWVNERNLHLGQQPLSGWWGHARPFAMEPGYEAHSGIRRFLIGTQPMTSLSLVECGLDIALAADMGAVRRKSLALTDLFIDLVEQHCGEFDLKLITPRDHADRGSHVSFVHAEGYSIMKALISRGVIGDYREPGVLRFGITPLYVGYVDVWNAVDVLRDILENKAWDTAEFREREAVT
ncbi:kynureninase [Rhodococcus sp. IEGM 1379]|uniref:kynureninase n=1 Tax=Rhodococcus sp. IEGM 1379 TaxID=3047086 RepID=UPI0024B6E50B|nr:kynureninase [Rhodococcus sp. IEGM 1379]MDI9913954.1 kynureninase [Rhodococcus sp. IEGM 1379]